MGDPPADPNDPFPAAGNRQGASRKILRQKNPDVREYHRTK